MASDTREPSSVFLEMNAVEIQQEYYEVIGDADWELFEKKDRRYLLQKVAIALYGPPTIEGNLMTSDNEEELKLQGYELKDTESVMKVFNKICEQEKYAHDGLKITISILKIVCVIPTKEIPFYKPTPANYWMDLHTKRGSDVTILVFHVFCIRKCISMEPGAKSCRIYIDHDARVYQSWNNYLQENILPKCVMVVPQNGEYKGDINVIIGEGLEAVPSVKLNVLPSPALGIGAQVLSVADTASTVAGLGAVVGIAAGLVFTPVAPVAFGAATGVAAVTGVYGIIRSSISLADRSKHEQSIGLEDAGARAAWINILVSSVGISLSAATKLITVAASSGTNVNAFIKALQFLSYTNLVTGFIGVANSLADMIHKYMKYGDCPTKLELFQFTTSALFFGLGAMSNQTAQEIVQDAQAHTINDIRDSLSSNNKRKIFDKVTAETRRLEGHVKGNSDVIKALKTIKNKDEFFAKFARINKQVNKNKVRISMTSDGSPLINNQHKVGMSELYGLGKNGRNELFAKYGPAKITSKNVPTKLYPSTSAGNVGNRIEGESAFTVRPEELIKITNLFIRLSQIDQEMVADILSQITRDLHDSFLLICADLIKSLLPNDVNRLIAEFGYDYYLIRVILFVFDSLKSKFGTTISSELSMENLLKEFIVCGRVLPETILRIKDELMKWLAQGEKRRENNSNRNYVLNFRKTYKHAFMSLETGEVVTVGQHQIMISANTLEKLEERLKDFSQEKCDRFMEICFRIIKSLSRVEVNTLNIINPDEDVIVRVAYFMVQAEIVLDMIDNPMTSLDTEVVEYLKSDLMEWRQKQKVREHQNCKECNGITYLKVTK